MKKLETIFDLANKCIDLRRSTKELEKAMKEFEGAEWP